ncbi:WhiB family transcriptional regulator [Streptomyces cocklensis]|uniref:Transcriptional regulator WhiB n=1 Tax=Actinacidiphila cocklensis TaxID=887465 RepID=A0A9W4DIM3_9ACTN|nr:WhiB family transcriptional regulator [Actinacidiphila cocklensis]MDD1062712.1 WhiB family transcriptional regulator [Actinacidiphila cocklensis]WSX75414.1 WhiB family transcriptional regulator [Streptomyces sp. NBC_00899]CAG6392056.1 Transcriptional regulator WhiB [Actinacidiphila cocklensis]
MNWRTKADCRHQDPDLFFPLGNTTSGLPLLQTEEAKAVCRACPVIAECLDWALRAGAVEGIWGGTTQGERHLMQLHARHDAGRAREALCDASLFVTPFVATWSSS